MRGTTNCLAFLLLTGLFLFATVRTVIGQDTATVYFYRALSDTGGNQIAIYHNGQYLEKIVPDKIERCICDAGDQIFSAVMRNGKEKRLRVHLKAGEVYFVHIRMKNRSHIARLYLEPDSAARHLIGGMRIQTVRSLSTLPVGFKGSIDTLAAITRLFELSRKRGSARASGFGILSALFFGTAVVGESETKTGPDYQSGSNKTRSSPNGLLSSFGMINGIAAGVLGVFGVKQKNKFNRDLEDEVTRDYKEGKPLPDWVKASLRPAHFGL